MAYDSIPDLWREVGKGVKKDLIDRIHDNLEDLDGRVTNVEGSVSTTIIANQTIKKERDHAPIGTMVWSPLSEAQFQTATDDGGWELCDGATAVGSDYGTLMSRSVLPDVRGRFLRMADGAAGRNPDGNVATDVAQSGTGSNFAHTHTINHGHSHTIAASGTFASSTHKHGMSHTHQVWYKGVSRVMYGRTASDPSLTTFSSSGSSLQYDNYNVTLSGSGFDIAGATGVAATSYYSSGVIDPSGGGSGSTAKSSAADTTASVGNSGSVTNYTGSSGSDGVASESRPINVTENLMIKVNKNYVTARTGYLLWRAPQALTINQVILTPVTQGTSGTLTVDIKKGVHGSISTSIFTATPTMLYSASTPQTGTLNATNAQIAAGEYVRVDITTTQAKLVEFHILIAATPS